MKVILIQQKILLLRPRECLRKYQRESEGKKGPRNDPPPDNSRSCVPSGGEKTLEYTNINFGTQGASEEVKKVM